MNKYKNTDWLLLLRNEPNQTLKTIYCNHRKNCVAWLCKNFKCRETEAEDIFQEAIIILYEKVQERKLTELRSSLKSYLYAISKHLAFQKQRKSIEVLFAPSSVEFLANQWVTQQTQETDINNKEQQILTVLQNLRNPCKTILYAYYFKKMSMEEIAQMMNYKSSDVVKTQKYRCMNKLFKIFLESKKPKD